MLEGAVVAGESEVGERPSSEDPDVGDGTVVLEPAELPEVLLLLDGRRAASPLKRPTPAKEAAANQAVAARARPSTAERCAAGDGMSQLWHDWLGKG